VTFTPEDQTKGEPEKERETARREGMSPDIRWHQRKDGSRVFINGAMHALRDGEVHGFLKIGSDRTAQHEAEEALRRSEERLRLILESAKGFAIFTTDAEGKINSWNPGAAHVFGWSEAEILGKSIGVLFTPEDQANGAPQKELERAQAEGIAPDIRWHQRKDGSRVFINGVVHPLGNEQLNGFVKIGRDETAEHQAEEAVREQQKQLQFLNEILEQKVEEKTEEVRLLASDVIKATQRERQRVSQILHDDLQQRAYGLKMQLSFLKNELPTENDAARKEVSTIEEGLAEIVRITRNLSIDLSPAILPGEGLSHAITWLAIRMKEQYSLPVELQANGPFVIPDEELHVFLFNCIRELLFNIVKHAEATQAVVALAWVDHGIRIEVHDNGKGFPVSTTEEEVNKQDGLPRSLGIPTIRHQLNLFGGHMEINSKPGDGTQIILIVPVTEGSQGVSSSGDI
jgi:PAS domain S-box-containing protein